MSQQHIDPSVMPAGDTGELFHLGAVPVDPLLGIVPFRLGGVAVLTRVDTREEPDVHVGHAGVTAPAQLPHPRCPLPGPGPVQRRIRIVMRPQRNTAAPEDRPPRQPPGGSHPTLRWRGDPTTPR